MTQNSKPLRTTYICQTCSYAIPEAADLITQLKQALEERDEWKDEYENLCKFATQFEAERDAALEKLKVAEAALEIVSCDEWEVISQSTGMRQSGPSYCADIAREALRKIRGEG